MSCFLLRMESIILLPVGQYFFQEGPNPPNVMFFSYQGEGLNNTIAPYSTYIYETLNISEAIGLLHFHCKFIPIQSQKSDGQNNGEILTHEIHNILIIPI